MSTTLSFTVILGQEVRCADRYKNGNACRCWAVANLDDIGPRCEHHLPAAVRPDYPAAHEEAQRKADAAWRRLFAPVDAHIMEVHKRAEPYRRVPPPEWLAFHLLYELQDGNCLTCSARGRSRRQVLIEDHDHRTGMVRGLLCQSCNALEGHGYAPFWTTYRKYAPGIGLYCRYLSFNMGAQWHPGNPDPLVGRIEMEFSSITQPEVYLEEYKRLIETMDSTPIPAACSREFDVVGTPLLLPGERYGSPDECPWGSWPIVVA